MSLRLDDSHPLRAARWIWPAPMMELVNCFAEFRKDIVLDEVPASAPFAITADQHYRLWVNGLFVGRGPARGYQQSWPVDEFDLAPFLRRGGNWIAIEGYTPGISTFRYLHQGVAGILCAGRWGAVEVRSDATWSMRRSPAHASATRRMSMQLDFQEHLDLAQLDRGWITEPIDRSDWSPREPIHGFQPQEVHVGCPPWSDLEARGIPTLAHALRPPRAAVALAHGSCAAGWRTWTDASWPWQGEADGLAWMPAGPENVIDDALVVTVPAAGAEGFAALGIDVGEYIYGNLLLEVDGGEVGAILDIHYHEALVDGRPDRRKPGDACSIALASRLRLAPGNHALELYHLLAFRAVTLVARGTHTPLRVRIRVRTARYPFTMRGSFACSDPLLEAIHGACRRTQQLCANDAYVDTPWREQAQWWGDARVQIRNTFHLDGDPRLAVRGIRSIADQPGPHGLTYGHAPTMAHNCILPDFSLTWILTICDLWWQTGDSTLLREQWPRIQQVLDYFDAPSRRHASGLLLHDRSLWYFGDSVAVHRGNVPTLLNLLYLLTLRRLAPALQAANLARPAAAIMAAALRHEQTVTEQLFDSASGTFCAGLDTADVAGVHEQTLALLLGLQPDSHQQMLASRLLPWVRGEATTGPVPSAFWSTYAFDALGAHGYGGEVVAFIRKHWQPMLATGTTWEHFTWSERDSSSASHAWTAHPASHLIAWLVGIRQTATAWRRVVLTPTVLPGIDRAAGMVPSPQGDIALSWTRQGERLLIDAEVPNSVDTTIILPGRKAQRWHGGGHRRWELDLPAAAAADDTLPRRHSTYAAQRQLACS